MCRKRSPSSAVRFLSIVATVLLAGSAALAAPPPGKGPKPTPEPTATADGGGEGHGGKGKNHPSPTPDPTATPAPTPDPAGPACGDTIASARTLTGDLVGCTGVGLRVVDGGRLDCAGYAVAGDAGSYGILVQAQGAEVRGCRVFGFDIGIRVFGGGSNLVVDNETHDNLRYGVGLGGATLANRLDSNLVHHNGDEGIHVGTACDGTVVTGNQIWANDLENLYVLSSRDCIVTGNAISSGGSAAIYAKHVANSYIADNQILDRPVQVRGESYGNVFEANDLSPRGFKFEAYDDAVLGCTYPHDNEVRDGSILGAPICFVFSGAYDNLATGVVADGCEPKTEQASCGREATGNLVELIPAG